jgi:hypothetical protein
LGESEHELALTRLNRYGPLIELGRLYEAQRVVEGCLDVYREVGDLTREARALGALSAVWAKRGDVAQAVALERQALAVSNRLPDPGERGTSHNNLSNYLRRAGREEEMARHQLAALVYFLVSGHRQHVGTVLRNLAIRIRAAAESGGRYELPRLAELLALGEFHALGQFLADRQIDPQTLQVQIDALVKKVSS